MEMHFRFVRLADVNPGVSVAIIRCPNLLFGVNMKINKKNNF